MLVMCLCVVLSLTACATIKLATPIGVRINYDKLTLSWVSVNDAVAYEIAVDGEPVEQVNRTSWAMSHMVPGEYQITVRAIGDGKLTKNSDWSEAVTFIRDAEQGLEFKLYNNSNEYMVSGIGTAGSNVVIPDFYRQKPVTKIEKGAFANQTRIRSVVVGANVTVIEEKAFDNCSFMESITFEAEKMQSIGENAFQRCWALKEITIPQGITTLPKYVFNYCRALEKVTFNSDLYVIDGYAFDGCTGLKEVVLPDSVVALGEFAFNNCSALESVTFGEGLLQIGQRCFAECGKLATLNFGQSNLKLIDQYAFTNCTSLTEVELPDSVYGIGPAVFSFCTNLATLTIGDNVSVMGAYVVHETALYEQAEDLVYIGNWVSYCKNPKLTTVTFKEGTVGIASQAFEGCLGLTVVEMPETIKYLGSYAFVSCQSLMSVTLSPQITEIPAFAFNDCISLMSVTFGPNVTTIEKYAFYNCTDLRNIYLPNTVTKIGLYAFRQTRLWTDSTPGDYVYVGDWVIGFKPALTPIMPDSIRPGTVGIADYAFYELDADYITMPDTIKYLGEYSFYRVSMTYLKLSANIKKVSDYAFFQCTELLNLNIPEGVEEIGRSAFYQIQATKIVLPKSVKTIGMYAFYRPAKLISVDLGTVETIGRGAFYNAEVLESLTIPASVKTIDAYAFYGCEMLQSLTINEGVEEIGEYAFAKALILPKLTLPDTLTTVGKYAFRDLQNCESLVLGSGLQSVGDGAFMKCAATTLVVDGNETVFGKYAFRGCSLMESIIIKNGVSKIDMHAFYGCTKATFYVENNTPMTNWDSRWNSSHCPVLSGVTLSADGKYVESFVKNQDTLVVSAGKFANAPAKDGYVFAGWATTLGGKAEYTMDTLKTVADGTTLYAVWNPAA